MRSLARGRGDRSRPYVSPVQHAILPDSLVQAAARLPRNQALGAISASLHISAALGGAEGLQDIRRAINNTARSYPPISQLPCLIITMTSDMCVGWASKVGMRSRIRSAFDGCWR